MGKISKSYKSNTIPLKTQSFWSNQNSDGDWKLDKYETPIFIQEKLKKVSFKNQPEIISNNNNNDGLTQNNINISYKSHTIPLKTQSFWSNQNSDGNWKHDKYETPNENSKEKLNKVSIRNQPAIISDNNSDDGLIQKDNITKSHTFLLKAGPSLSNKKMEDDWKHDKEKLKKVSFRNQAEIISDNDSDDELIQDNVTDDKLEDGSTNDKNSGDVSELVSKMKDLNPFLDTNADETISSDTREMPSNFWKDVKERLLEMNETDSDFDSDHQENGESEDVKERLLGTIDTNSDFDSDDQEKDESELKKFDTNSDLDKVGQEKGEAELIKIDTNSDLDSDDQEEDESELNKTSTNPFLNVSGTILHSDVKDLELNDNLSAERKMNIFIKRIQSKEAVPAYALSDAVFYVDKPKNAVNFGVELPLAPFEEHKVGNLLMVTITEIYSPFQFWFQDSKQADSLNQLNYELQSFYSCGLRSKLSPYFIKTGYLCAVYHQLVWRRGRIVGVEESKKVCIYLVDYGTAAKVPPEDLYFLHKRFMEWPAMLIRGTLTDVHPGKLHWPLDAIDGFRFLVSDREMHACIKDIDLRERILFLDLTDHHSIPISKKLISAKLAAPSSYYSEKARAEYGGRRIRYIRERLPTFDMLESQLFGADTEDFEDAFDEIIYSLEYLKDQEKPVVPNPFRSGLQEALNNWLEKC